MTVSELVEKGKEILRKADVENSANEAVWIFENSFNCQRQFLFFNSDKEADEAKADDYLKKVNLRASGVPVQYVIGEWDFFGETFSVG